MAADQALLTQKTGSVPTSSWLLVDNNGQSWTIEVDKYVVMDRVRIHARDLRILDPIFCYPSTILGRENVIVLNLEHIKALITAEEVLLRDPLDDNLIPIVEELQRRLSSYNLITEGKIYDEGKEEHHGERDDVEPNEYDEFPFEFQALDVTLEAVCSYLDARTRELEIDTYPALNELTSKISGRSLDRLRRLKSLMTRLMNRVHKVREEIGQLLANDDDMAELYLSRKLAQSSSLHFSEEAGLNPRWFPDSSTLGSKMSRASRLSEATNYQQENDVEQLEALLEVYYMQIDRTLNKLVMLREYVDNTEDYLNFQLDNNRNRLIQIGFFISSGTFALSIYSLVAAIFGMRIPHTWGENHGYVFKWVVIVTGISCLIIFLATIYYAHRRGLVGSVLEDGN